MSEVLSVDSVLHTRHCDDFYILRGGWSRGYSIFPEYASLNTYIEILSTLELKYICFDSTFWKDYFHYPFVRMFARDLSYLPGDLHVVAHGYPDENGKQLIINLVFGPEPYSYGDPTDYQLFEHSIFD